MKYRKMTALLLGMALAVSTGSAVLAAETEQGQRESAPAEESENPDMTAMFSKKDVDDSWDDTAVQIALEGTSAKAAGSRVQIDGATVTITGAGTYVLSGDLTDGQIIVDADETEDVKLVLNGVAITNEDSACVFVKSADKAILTLAEESENTLSDGGTTYVQPDGGSTVDGVIFSREDLSVNGTGMLVVEAGYKHGIVCKDDLVIAGGTITVTAKEKGVVGEDSVRIKDGTVAVTAGDDAVHASTEDKEGKGFVYVEGGELILSAGDDGIHAETALIIAGGKIDVNGCEEGLEGATIDILDGDIRVIARDDGLNAAHSESDPEGDRPDGREYKEVYEGGWEYEDIDKDDWPDVWEYEDIDEDDWPDGWEYGDVNEGPWPDDGEMMYGPRPGRRGGRPGRGNFGGGPEGPGGSFGDVGEPGDRYGYERGMQEPYEGMPGVREDRMDGGTGGMRSGFGMMDVQEDSYLRIAGGTIYVNADGDGLDSNGYIYLEGGTVIVQGPTNDGNGALDYGIDAVVTGGTLMASGSAGMAEGFSNGSSQRFLYYTFDTGIRAGTEVSITDENGKEVFTYTPDKMYRNVVFTSPDLEEGAVYTITAGSVSGTVEA